MNFPPAQRNVCKITMYSNNFNTTLNVSTKEFLPNDVSINVS